MVREGLMEIRSVSFHHRDKHLPKSPTNSRVVHDAQFPLQSANALLRVVRCVPRDSREGPVAEAFPLAHGQATLRQFY